MANKITELNSCIATPTIITIINHRKNTRAMFAPLNSVLSFRQHEVGVVLFGLPETETANKLNDDDSGDYLGVKEYCM